MVKEVDDVMREKLGAECDFYLGNLYEAANTPKPIDPNRPNLDQDDCINEVTLFF